MATAKQDARLQEAIDGLPCKLAKGKYFDAAGDACIVGHLGRMVSPAFERHLRKQNEMSLWSISDRFPKRLMRVFGFQEHELSDLQYENDSPTYTSKHRRCRGMAAILRRILKERA